jgi:DNA-directed RNA polymerase specialized sigma24 family protein
VVKLEKRTLVLNEMKLSQALRIMMAESNVQSFAEIARDLGMKETTFRSAISRDSIRLSDFLALADILGYEVMVKDKTVKK